MADSAPKAIKVEALKDHTYNGKQYRVGDTYDFVPNDNPASGISADDQVHSLQTTGFAVRVDRADVAKAQLKAAEKSASAVAAVAKKSRAPRATRKGKK